MYGRHVHEGRRQAAGVKVSGRTVHLVDEEYDHGHIVLQATVPVLAERHPETLAARVRAQEHWIYPSAVALVCRRPRQIADGIVVKSLPLEASPRINARLDLGLGQDRCRGIRQGPPRDWAWRSSPPPAPAKALVQAGLPVRRWTR